MVKMLNRSCLGYDTPGYSSSPGQLSSNFKSPKGVKDGELDVKSLYNNSEEDLLRHTGGLKGNMYVLKQSPIHPLPYGRGLLGQSR